LIERISAAYAFRAAWFVTAPAGSVAAAKQYKKMKVARKERPEKDIGGRHSDPPADPLSTL